ncbi:nuclease-related domain-containing protein [Nocardia sp. CA-120079]|uniref:nuclease-related domain-containing protein n=1 Tax=Nocardia sp. CA-120079 TaxID=3239974 RepID=UPI003D98783B
MRVKVLSDHGGEQLHLSEQQLQGAAADHAAWQGYYAHAYGELEATRRTQPLWKRLLSVPTADEQAARVRVGDVSRQVDSAEEEVQRAYNRVQQKGAGVYGEDLLTWSLAGLLPDEWVMLRGYRNRRGETDHVLVGPAGVWAVEVKRRRVLLHAVGDQWWFQKISAQGRVCESEWAVDGGGRSWPRQVGEVAHDLAARLERQGHHLGVRTAVMMIHEHAQLVECVTPGVDFVGSDPWQLTDTILGGLATPLSQNTCEDIVALVERDHHFHASRRRAR